MLQSTADTKADHLGRAILRMLQTGGPTLLVSEEQPGEVLIVGSFGKDAVRIFLSEGVIQAAS